MLLDGCGSIREERECCVFTATCCERCCSFVCPTSGYIIRSCPATVPAMSAATWPATRTTWWSGDVVTASLPCSCCWTCRVRTPLPVVSLPIQCCRSVRSLWHCHSFHSDAAANRRPQREGPK